MRVHLPRFRSHLWRQPRQLRQSKHSIQYLHILIVLCFKPRLQIRWQGHEQAGSSVPPLVAGSSAGMISLKHQTLKTGFSPSYGFSGRHSELQALVFDPKYIQFNPKGAGVTLYIPSFMHKNQKVGDSWYIPAVPTAKSNFAPNCPVRALRYYHRYITEPRELRKGRRCLFVLIKDNNTGKGRSAATISGWICTTSRDI